MQPADLGDLAIPDADIGDIRRQSRPIDDSAILYQ
jgi:hypothetical protein